MRRLTRRHLSIRISLVRVLSLLLLAFVFALMGWLFYVQPTSPGEKGEEGGRFADRSHARVGSR